MKELSKCISSVHEGSPISSFVGQMFGGQSPDEKKAEIIRSFPIPNTKADLLDFSTALLPLSRTRSDLGEESATVLGKAYYQKLLECENRIRVNFSDDKDFAYILQQINREKRRLSGTLRTIAITVVLILGITVLYGVVCLMT